MSLPVSEFLTQLAGAQVMRTKLDYETGYLHLALSKNGQTQWVALRMEELVFGEAARPFTRALNDGGILLHDTGEDGPCKSAEPRSVLINPEDTVAVRAQIRERLRLSGLRGL
jgi:hypothetical protein